MPKLAKHHWPICCWPGLPQLWRQGAVWGFLLALLAGCWLNVLLMSTFVWREWMPPQTRLSAWFALALVWAASGVGSYWWYRRKSATADEPGENDLLTTATVEYLRGNWYQAELILWQALKRDRRDVEAMLMLATICRHTKRLDEAAERLDELGRWDRAAKWTSEIARERRLLEDKRERLSGETEPAAVASNEGTDHPDQTDQLLPMNDSGDLHEQNTQTTVDISSSRAA